MKFCYLFFQKPYAGFFLNSVKNLEMPWWPVLYGHRHCTLAIPMVYQDWKDSASWELLEWRIRMSPTQIQALPGKSSAME